MNIVSLTAIFLALSYANLAYAEVVKPNLIFIFADDWGYGDLGIHGSTFCETPRLDKMASEGTDFQSFTVNSPVCSPSRVAAITGQFPARHSVHQHFSTVENHIRAGMPDWLDPAAPLLPRMLQKAGYVTAHFGKWHLSNDGVSDGPMPDVYGYDVFGAFNLPFNAPEQMKTVASCPRAVEFIRKNKEKPFFINLWLHETHTPHYPLDKYLAKFDQLEDRQKVYAAIVAEGDAGVGLIIDTLKDLGLEKNTLIIFSSDNGPENTGKGEANTMMEDKSTGPGLNRYYSVGETGGLKGRKRSLFSGGIRVPCIAYWPGVVPAGRVDRESRMTAVDILPTFMELAGASLPDDYQPDGESVVKALKGESWRRSKPVFWQYRPARFPHMGVQDGRWKLLADTTAGKLELYNLDTDWAEKNDVSEIHPEVVDTLKRKLLKWRDEIPKAPPEAAISSERSERQ